MNLGKVFVYALLDPRSGKVRYIGQTTRGMERLRAHIKEARLSPSHNHRLDWIRSLLAAGYRPVLVVLFRCANREELNIAERRWIEVATEWGCSLTNGTEGGDGTNSPTRETRAKIGAAHKGKVLSPEVREKVRLGNIRRFADPSERDRVRQKRLGRGLTDTAKAKQSESLIRFYRNNPDAVAHQSAKMKERLASPEARKAWGAAHRGHHVPPGTGAKISASKMGHTVSEETRRKISETKRARRALLENATMDLFADAR